MSLATFLSGKLVSWQRRAPANLRSYHLNFIIAVTVVLASYMLLFLLHLKIRRSKQLQKNSNNNNISCSSISNNNNTVKTSTKEEAKKKSLLGILFDLNNVRQTIGCFFKRRPNNLRLQIYLLCSVLFNQVLVTNGLNAVLLQFSEKVYQWSGSQYATFSAIQQMTQMSLLGLLLILLINVLKLEQSTLILLSQVSILVTDLIRGLFLSQLAFFVTLPIGKCNLKFSLSTLKRFSFRNSQRRRSNINQNQACFGHS